MIRFLEGKVRGKNDNEITLAVGGVGYGVLVSAHTYEGVAIGEIVEIHAYTHVREQEITLYGFATMPERTMFELLISVSGIGPKAALAILSAADVAAVSAAIANEDTSILTNVSGIGKKTAERVVRELQGKVEDFAPADIAAATRDSSAVEALKSMGYSIGEARDALAHVDKNITDVGERIKYALKNLG